MAVDCAGKRMVPGEERTHGGSGTNLGPAAIGAATQGDSMAVDCAGKRIGPDEERTHGGSGISCAPLGVGVAEADVFAPHKPGGMADTRRAQLLALGLGCPFDRSGPHYNVG